MDNVRIKRVAYDQSIYDRLKHLIPLGENIIKLDEDEHISRLSRPPVASPDFDYDSFVSLIDGLKAKDAQDLFSVTGPKPNSARITLVFNKPGAIDKATIWVLRKKADPCAELYIGSKSFRHGIFITHDEIAIWERPNQ